MKGIVYVMNTAVSGLIKIGKTGLQNYNERMRHLERNGYYNVSGLKQFFAIELNDYDDKEALLHEIFTFCGGVNITLPDDVIIENEVRGFLGGTDDKTLPKDSAKKTLYLKGECILGGLEIK